MLAIIESSRVVQHQSNRLNQPAVQVTGRAVLLGQWPPLTQYCSYCSQFLLAACMSRVEV